MSENNKYRVIVYLDGFHPIKNGQKISNCEFGFEEENKKYFISTGVTAGNEKEAMMKGDIRLGQVVSVITLQTGVRYHKYGIHVKQISGKKPFTYSSFLDLKRTVFLPLDKQKLDAIEETIKTLDTLPFKERSTEIINKAINYYLRGCSLETEWRSESFLNFYKAIELITNEFRKDFDERLASQLSSTILNIVTDKEIKDLRTPRRLIHFTCEKIGLNPSCNISSILDLRNRFSAHARLKEINVPDEDYIACKSLSAKIILWYLQFIKVEN